MIKSSKLRSLSITLGIGLSMSAFANYDVYVAPNGSPNYDGSSPTYTTAATGPLATIQQAIYRVRTLRKQHGGDTSLATIHVAYGIYQQHSSTKLDGSAWQPYPDNNIRIQGVPTNGHNPQLCGGVRITNWVKGLPTNLPYDPTLRIPASAQPNIYYVQNPVGATGQPIDFGQMQVRNNSTYLMTSPPAELSFNGVPMQLTTFPSSGWMNASTVAINGTAAPYTATLGLSQAMPTASVTDGWVQGWWANDNAQQWQPIASSTSTSQITVSLPGVNNPSTDTMYLPTTGARFRVVNVLENLSQPGEYYIDRTNGVVYFWAPSDPNAADTVISDCSDPLLDDYMANNITVDSIDFAQGKLSGLNFFQCSSIFVSNCRVFDIGNIGMVFHACSSCRLDNDIVRYTDDTAVYMNSPFPHQLQMCANYIQNCWFGNFGSFDQGSHPGLYLNDDGYIVDHCTFTSSPCQAIILNGSLDTVQFCRVSKVLQEMSDTGAIWAGLDVTNRGTLLQYNALYDISSWTPRRPGPFVPVVGVYLDDFSSGFTVANNIFYGINQGVLIGGGWDNHINNNAFPSVTVPTSIDSRGQSSAFGWWFYLPGYSGYYQNCSTVAYYNPVKLLSTYMSAFPTFADLVNHNGNLAYQQVPRYNTAYINYFDQPQAGKFLWLFDGFASSAAGISVYGSSPGASGLFTNMNLWTPDFTQTATSPMRGHLPDNSIGATVHP